MGVVRRLRLVVLGTSCALGMSLVHAVSAPPADVPLSISIVGNHFVDGSGARIRLLGVDHTSAEYGCVDGFGYDDGHFDARDAAAIASWGADAVRIPLNEDCWLGLNGQPNSDEGADPPLTQLGYQTEIENYVHDLNARGIYAILDLHWTAPGTQVALEQQPMPDLDHSPAFWTSVATAFKSDPAVVFDLFNEPFDPTDPRSGDDKNPNDKVSWDCWANGTQPDPLGGGAMTNCVTQAYDDAGRPTTRYQIAGLQTLLDAIRATGATQPVLAGGLDYANDLGDHDHGGQWMNHAPNDPLNQEAASFHNYMGKVCDNLSCWKNAIAPVAKHVPVVTGEFDEDDFDQAKCAHQAPSTFDADYMNWADSAGVSYLAWGWIVESRSEQNADRCSAYFLIDDYSAYTPAAPNGVALHDHLRALATGKPQLVLTAFGASVGAGNRSVRISLRTKQNCRASVTAAASGIALGTAHASLSAGRSHVVSVSLPSRARKTLVGAGSLRLRVTITLTSTKNTRDVVDRAVTVHAVG